MNRAFYKSIMAILLVWLFYQIVNSSSLIVMFMIGLVFMFLYKTSARNSDNRNQFLWLSLIFFSLSIVFTSAFWAVIIAFLLIQLNSDQKLVETLRDPLLRKKQYWRDKEFITVEWNEEESKDMKLYRNKWFGDDFVGKDVFEWEDKNFQKIMGDTFFDLGNTILPKKENILLIRKGFGDTKILIPKDVAISLDVSIGLGKLVIDEEIFDLKNETIKWRSDNYPSALRKIRIVSSTLLGEVEVVYL